MSIPTFLDILRSEVAKFQGLHPERVGEIARAHALILHGQVLPSADDPQTGQVLSSDGATRYRVNGVCDCQAGQHGKPCKHQQAWRLYQYVARKVEAAPALLAQSLQGETEPVPGALPEAPASVNCHLTIDGRQVQLTLRDTDESRLLARLQAVLAQYPAPQPPVQPPGQPQGQGWCAVHNVPMKEHSNAKGTWYSHFVDGAHCKGKRGGK